MEYFSSKAEQVLQSLQTDPAQGLSAAEAARRLEDLFGRDPIRRQEGIRQQVEEWKQEYRAMA